MIIKDYLYKSLLQEEDYYRMAFRKYLGKADYNLELKFMKTVYLLKDMYPWEKINKLINENKIAK